MFELLRKDLSLRYIVVFTTGCMIPVIFSGAMIYNSIEQNLRLQSTNQAKNNLEIRRRYIHTWLGDRAYIVSELANYYDLNPELARREFLPAFVERSDDFQEVFLLSSEDGVIFYSTNEDNLNKVKRDRTYFIEGRKRLYTSQIYFSPSLNGPAMTISMPLKSNTGQVLAARVNLERLTSTLALTSPNDTLITTYLVNKWNAFVICDDAIRPKLSNFSEGIQRAIEQGKYSGVYNDWRGEQVIGACEFIEELGAVLVSEVNYSRAMRDLRYSVTGIILILMLAVFITTGLFYFVLKRTLQPIKEISKAAIMAAEGNLNVRVKTDNEDLIGKVAASFNTMVSRLAENLHELKTSKEKQYRLIERANDGFITIDRFGNIIDVNPSVSKMWGFTQPELHSMLVFELFEEENARVLGRHIRRLDHDDSPGLIELNALKKNGESFPTEINAISLGDGSYLAIVRDTSEKKILERELVQAQKLESVGTLSAGIAHDFNNILVGILGAVSLIKSSSDSADPRYEMLEVIETSAERAAGLVKQLMTFARQEPPHRMPISIEEKIDELMRVLRSGEANSKITFKVRLASNLPAVYADPVQIEQTLFNLCNNAIDAMPDGGELTVEVSKVEIDPAKGLFRIPRGDYIEIAISDTGSGIPDDKLDKIFEPFFTTKAPGKGTGLGLSISYGIIESHGGTINVDSVEGVGSTFRIYLPAISSDDHCQLAFKQNVIIIDKDPYIRRLYRVALDNSYFSISSYPSIEHAVLETKKVGNKTDLIILGANSLAEDWEAGLFKLNACFEGVRTVLLGKIEGVKTESIEAIIPDPHNLKEALEYINSLTNPIRS